MAASSRSIEFASGAATSIVFKLFSSTLGVTGPLDVSGASFEIRLANGQVRTTAEGGGLVLVSTGGATTLTWNVASEAWRNIAGPVTTFVLTRIDGGSRRAYLTGALRGVAGGGLSVTVSIVVSDTAIETSGGVVTVGQTLAQIAANAETAENAAEAAQGSAGAAQGSANAAASSKDAASADAATASTARAQAQTYRDSAMAAASNQTAVYDTKSALDANTTAVVGIVRSGVDVGTYERSTPNNPATAWVKTSTQNVFTLDARQSLTEGYTKTVPIEHDYPRRIPADAKTVYQDKFGVIKSIIDLGGSRRDATASGATSFSAADIIAENEKAVLYSTSISNATVPADLQDILLSGVSLSITIGQSLAAKAQMHGDPGDATPYPGHIMIGQADNLDETNTGRARSTGGAHAYGSISGTVFTVTEVEGDARVKVGATLIATGVSPGVTITNQIDGTPYGPGNYTISSSQTVAARWIICRDTRDDRFTPARPTVRPYENLTNVLDGFQSVGSPPFSVNPQNPNWHRLLGYQTPNLGFGLGFYADRATKQIRNRLASRSPSFSGEMICTLNVAVGATGLAEWTKLTTPYNAGTTFIRGNRITWPATPYGAATLTAGSSTGNQPPLMGEGETNAYWSIGTDCFNRFEEGVQLFKDVAAAEMPDAEAAVLDVIIMQGTNDSGRGNAAAYQATYGQVRTDIDAVIAAKFPNQKRVAKWIYNEQVNECGFRATPTAGYSPSTTFAAGDILRPYNLFTWVSLENGNIGHEPSVSPTWWARLTDRAIWRGDVNHAKHDLVTHLDRGFRSLIDNNLNHPPLVSGTVDTARWAEVIGTWTTAGHEVDDAKLNIAKTSDDTYLFGCGYGWWHKRLVHGSANWPKHGALFLAKARQQVIANRCKWLPLHCFEATVRDKEILAKFHVPEGSLRIKPVYRDYNPIVLPHWGVGVYDTTSPRPNAGVPTTTPIYLPSQGLEIGTYSLEIVATNEILIKSPRTLVGDTWLTFGDPGRSYSLTNIFDGAAWGAANTYAYSKSKDGVPANDMHPVEAPLKDQPFDMANPCVPHSIKCIRA